MKPTEGDTTNPTCDHCGDELTTQDEIEIGVCQSEINAWAHTKTLGTCNGNHMKD